MSPTEKWRIIHLSTDASELERQIKCCRRSSATKNAVRHIGFERNGTEGIRKTSQRGHF